MLKWSVDIFLRASILLKAMYFIMCGSPLYSQTVNICYAIFLSQYFIYSCILGLISCSVFLRINYELKMVIMLIALVGYNVILLHTHGSMLDDYSKFMYATAPLKRQVNNSIHYEINRKKKYQLWNVSCSIFISYVFGSIIYKSQFKVIVNIEHKNKIHKSVPNAQITSYSKYSMVYCAFL